ncbi:hypothetical protein FGO68_gene5834 [Halteria grandinella]|uniref:Poly(A) RNA polymerase mitochondrial-like central palm domain-containing protein n=1 Tax=Halteria grandinella TaxID=5974 RepID=A0A8J8T378_HALGN|nr:hypothetical protein FGO68_gene5834 [Halteria grandinella]
MFKEETPLSEQIAALYQDDLMPTEADLSRVQSAFNKLSKALHQLYPPQNCLISVVPYGSTINGLALKGEDMSDLDVTLVFQNAAEWAKNVGQEIFSIQQKNRERDFLDYLKVMLPQKCIDLTPRAYQPIQETSFGALLHIDDATDKVSIELQINKVLDPYNSKLIQTYCLYDIRFHQLALILKKWNKSHFKDNTKRINSYSITLMLIAYLQHIKILPYLQQLPVQRQEICYFKHVFKGKAYQFGYNMKTDIAFETNPESIEKGFRDKEREQIKVEILLAGFFDFYLETFQPQVHAIRICKGPSFIQRVGIMHHNYKDYVLDYLALYPKLQSKLQDDEKRSALVLIDPFDKGYNPGKTVSKGDWQEYKIQFQSALEALKRNRLDEIFC